MADAVDAIARKMKLNACIIVKLCCATIVIIIFADPKKKSIYMNIAKVWYDLLQWTNKMHFRCRRAKIMYGTLSIVVRFIRHRRRRQCEFCRDEAQKRQVQKSN